MTNPCVKDCLGRSATCRATCEKYREYELLYHKQKDAGNYTPPSCATEGKRRMQRLAAKYRKKKQMGR